MEINNILYKMLSAHNDMLSCNNGLQWLYDMREYKKELVKQGLTEEDADDISLHPIDAYCRYNNISKTAYYTNIAIINNRELLFGNSNHLK